jgi:hypothetical protein
LAAVTVTARSDESLESAMAIRSGKISAITECAATAAVVHIFALRPFAFIVINLFSSRRRASLAQDFTKPTGPRAQLCSRPSPRSSR